MLILMIGVIHVHSSNTDQVALNERLTDELTVAVDWFRENGLIYGLYSKKLLTLALEA